MKIVPVIITFKDFNLDLIGTRFDKAVLPLVFKMPKMNAYVKTFKVKEGDKDFSV